MGMYGREKNGVRVGTDIVTGPGLTKQSFANEVDINKIVASFEKTGMINSVNAKEPFYGDVSGVRSYQECLDVVKSADLLFKGMDAGVRRRFNNDPEEMIAFLDDPKNLDEAVALGMVVKRPVEPVEPQILPEEVSRNVVKK